MEQNPATESTPAPRKGRREGLLLILVALFGIGGIALLQFSQKTPVVRSTDRAVVQTPGNTQEGANKGQNSASIQSIPGELIKTNEQPEAGKPFLFKMSKFSQGAVYELDTGDGHRKPFVNGVLQHTYSRPGPYTVTLWARFEGQEVALQTDVKRVGQSVEKPDISTKIDF